MTLIPYIGVFVSAIIPIIIALITKDTFWYAGGVVLVFVIVQVLEGNVITPKIVGDKVGLNPLVVIIGIVIFGAIAGVAGMIITIPVLALFKIIAEHAPGWEPIKLLLKA
jgi:predicted PurR-regulated permease PerM